MTYQYKCRLCENEWEVEQRITDEPIQQCPKCGELSAERQICCQGFVLQGECWSRDGYR